MVSNTNNPANSTAVPVTQTQPDPSQQGNGAGGGTHGGQGGAPTATATNAITNIVVPGAGTNGTTAPLVFKWWSASWAGPAGKISKYLNDKAESMEVQKDHADKVCSVMMDPATMLPDHDNKPVAFLIHVTGDTKVRVLYGLSPIIPDIFDPTSVSFFRALMREPSGPTIRYPGIMTLPADTCKVLDKITVPTDAKMKSTIDNDEWDQKWPIFKSSGQGKLKDSEKEEVSIMKIAPVPWYTVVDGLEEDLEAADMFERLSSIYAHDKRDSIRHAMDFTKACAMQFGANAKKPTIPASYFAKLANADDKTWGITRTLGMCPNLKIEEEKRNDATGGEGFSSAEMLKLMQQMLTNQQQAQHAQPVPGTNPSTKPSDTALDEDSWEKKLNMSTSGVAELTRFCGLAKGEESLIPQLWFKLGATKMTKQDKQREIRRWIYNKPAYPEVDAPITVSLLKIIANADWCEGEDQVTLANIMKGLSIFAMRPLTDDELSTMNDYDERLARATATTMQDVAGGSSKRKHAIPKTCEELEVYIKSLVNIIYPISNGGNPLGDDLKSIIVKLQKWPRVARRGMDTTMIASIMWVILEESRRVFEGQIVEKLPGFRNMMNALDSRTAFTIIGLPAGLIATEKKPTVVPGTPLKPKRGRGAGEEEKKTDEEEGLQPSPSKHKKVEINPIITAELGVTINKARGNRISINGMCQKVNMKIWEVFPNKKCGYATTTGKCSNRSCRCVHEPLTDEEAKQVVAHFKPLIDDPTILTG